MKGCKEILNHPWMQKLPFEGLMNKTMAVPFKPNINQHDKLDVSAFDKNITAEEAAMTMLPQVESAKLKKFDNAFSKF